MQHIADNPSLDADVAVVGAGLAGVSAARAMSVAQHVQARFQRSRSARGAQRGR